MKKLLIAGAMLQVFGLQAQDIHFTQTAQTPLLINPASTGVFNGWERVIINHRNQWLGASTTFMTTNIAADFNVLKKPRNEGAHMGVGVHFFNDVGGDANFGQRQGAVSLSGIIPMGGNGHIISAGIQGGFGNRSGNAGALSFRSQWDGSKFDQTILTGEENKLQTFNFFDASAGLYYVFDRQQSTFQRNREFKFQIGFAGYHLNAPKLRFSNGSTETMYRKFVGHIGMLKEIGTSKMSIDASAVHIMQGPHMETIFGFMMRYRFVDGTKITGNSQDAFFAFGCYARLKDAIMPSIMIDWRGFQFGISYDVTVSTLRKAYGGGSLEFSLSYVNRNHSLFKTRRKGFR